MLYSTFLTREQERDLAIRWRDSRDIAARDQLILAYRPLIARMAKKYLRYGVPKEDLHQECIFGLLRALDKFEPERDMRFATYAQWWVRAALQEYVLRNSAVIGHKNSNGARLAFFRGESRIDCIPFEAPISKDGGSLADVLESEELSPERAAEAAVDTERTNAKLYAALDLLDARSRQIIQARWLAEDSDTLESASKKFGISRERVRQIETKAMALIKTALDGGSIVPRRRGAHIVMVPAE